MDLEHKAIERIKMASEMSLYHYGKPLICTYSGGKDSDVMLELFIRSWIPFEAHNNHTTADVPETVRHMFFMLWMNWREAYIRSLQNDFCNCLCIYMMSSVCSYCSRHMNHPLWIRLFLEGMKSGL